MTPTEIIRPDNAAPAPPKSAKDPEERKRRRSMIFSIIYIAFGLCVGIGGLVYWYNSQDHSIYSKLTTASYNKRGVVYGFKYPSVLKQNTNLQSKLQYTPLVYSNYTKNNFQVHEYVSYYDISPI